jgi:GT2 family glycosyltransferase
MKNPFYKLSDITVVIPTCNRVNDINKTLKSLLKFVKSLNEIIIVDQSRTNETKNLIKSLKNNKIGCLFSKTPSITIARNLGASNVSKKSKIICFLDDDVTLGDNYFAEILKVFNENPEAKAVTAADSTTYSDFAKQGRLHRFIKKLFFLGHYEPDRARMTSSYGNTYPLNLKKTINAQWIPGLNMAYKKEVFNEQKFDENLLGYTVVEDLDFSFRLFKKYPNSLFITPYATLEHRASRVAREPTLRLSYINQIDHFYFNFKDFNKTLKEKLIFVWAIFGILLLRTLSLLSFKKSEFMKFSYFISSSTYCLTNLDKIRKGRLRDFITAVQ